MSSFSLVGISGACASRHGGFVEAGVYDSACKLLSLVRTKFSLLPSTAIRFAFLKILLEQLRRNHHVWCLVNLPEVVCERNVNQHLGDGTHSHVCEDTNSLIDDRTVPSCEITRGRFYVFGMHCFVGRLIQQWSSATLQDTASLVGHM